MKLPLSILPISLSSDKLAKHLYCYASSVTNKEAYIRGQHTSFKVYSEKATKFCEISNVDLTVTTWDKSMVEISQTFVAFSEYMNFTCLLELSVMGRRE